MTRRNKQPVSKNAFYTALAAIAFAVLAVGARLSAAGVAKKDPTTQSFHLIGFGFIYLVAVLCFLVFLCAAWGRFYRVPREERLAHPFLRKVTFGALLLSAAFVVFEVVRIAILNSAFGDTTL